MATASPRCLRLQREILSNKCDASSGSFACSRAFRWVSSTVLRSVLFSRRFRSRAWTPAGFHSLLNCGSSGEAKTATTTLGGDTACAGCWRPAPGLPRPGSRRSGTAAPTDTSWCQVGNYRCRREAGGGAGCCCARPLNFQVRDTETTDLTHGSGERMTCMTGFADHFALCELIHGSMDVAPVWRHRTLGRRVGPFLTE